MNRKRITSKELIDEMELTRDFTKLPIDAQYLKINCAVLSLNSYPGINRSQNQVVRIFWLKPKFGFGCLSFRLLYYNPKQIKRRIIRSYVYEFHYLCNSHFFASFRIIIHNLGFETYTDQKKKSSGIQFRGKKKADLVKLLQIQGS